MKTSLLFGIHCHQPIDNVDDIVKETIEKSYKPFFEALRKYPAFKCSVHFSGWLFEFIQAHDEALFILMQELSPQLEFFSGGYYEPMLSAIPSEDRIGQIMKLNKFIKKHFNQTPRGLWLSEKVWDNALIPDLKECGIDYVIIDDYPLIINGYDAQGLNGYFVTEEGGKTIGLFPTNNKLRYQIASADTDESVRMIGTFKSETKNEAAIFFDDSTLFALWSDTDENLYRKWLENFLEASSSTETFETQTFTEFYTDNPPIDLVYLPTLSYAEMEEWSLRPDNALKFKALKEQNGEESCCLKGGIWKNFFTKYQESNWIHKRLLELSNNQLPKKIYREALYKAECHDVLWHGVFGGIYLPKLRDNAYKYIIECELMHKNSGCVKVDIDFDGFEEYKFYTDFLLGIISTKNGGQIMELDLLSHRFNLQNTLSRYKEARHNNINQEQFTLYYDWHPKKSNIDHISNDLFSIENFKNAAYREYGDFTNQAFEKIRQKKNTLVLQREGGIYDNSNKKFSTSMEKKFRFKDNTVYFDISLATQAKETFLYINEWNLHFSDVDALTINDQPYRESLQFESNTLTIDDAVLKQRYTFAFHFEVGIYIVPIKTISQSKNDTDFILQGLSFGFSTPFSETLEFDYSFSVEEI